MEEIWKLIEKYENFYEVSNLGRVRSVDRHTKSQCGFNKFRKGCLIKPQDSYGYWSVGIHVKGVRKRVSVHRLVALAFIPNPENKKEVNHIDGNPKNNNVENLEWVTRQENTVHAHKLGLIKFRFGDNHAQAKLKEPERKEIRALYSTNNYTQLELAKLFKVSTHSIFKAVHNICYIKKS